MPIDEDYDDVDIDTSGHEEPGGEAPREEELVTSEPAPEPSVEQEEVAEDPIFADWLEEDFRPDPHPGEGPPPAPQPYPARAEEPTGPWFNPERFNEDPGGYLSSSIDERATIMARRAAEDIIRKALPEVLGPVANQLQRLQDTSRIEAARLTGDVKRTIDSFYRSELSNDASFRAKGDVYNIVDQKIREDFVNVQRAMRAGNIRELADRAEVMMNPLYAKGTLALAKLAAEHRKVSRPLSQGKAKVESSRKAPASKRAKVDPTTKSALDRWGIDADEYAKSLDDNQDLLE